MFGLTLGVKSLKKQPAEAADKPDECTSRLRQHHGLE